jgi:hypothetical protein
MRRKIMGILFAMVLVASLGLAIAVQTATPVMAATLTLYPNGAGDYTNIDSQSPSSGAHWDKVDEASADDATTYVYTSSDSQQEDAYALQDTSQTGTINSVTVYFRFRSSASTIYNAFCQPFLRLGASETAGTEQSTQSTTWTTYSETLARPGGGSWSWTDINDLQVCIGLRHTSIVSSYYAQCTQVYVVVDYTVNQAPTDIALSNSSVAENEPVNTVVGNFSTTDPNAGDTFTYTLVSGTGDTDNGSFNILNSSLRTSASFDYETKSSYSIRVRSTDQGGLWVEKQFTITVTNVNDTPTDISLSPSSVAENQPVNTVVGNFSTTDADTGNTFTYTLVSGAGDTDNGSFNILGSSLRTSASFDYETKNSCSIRVRSTDQGSLWVEKQFTITVTNVDYYLAISSTSGGLVTEPGEGVFTYDKGTVVGLVAAPDVGYRFDRWTGDVDTIVDVESMAITIPMNDSYSIAAKFVAVGWYSIPNPIVGGGCFIATAAYGTPMAEEIQILRAFRDEYLLTNPMGRLFVAFYYRVSPPIAEFITEHPSLKSIVRAGLAPAVAMSTVAVDTTPAEKMAMIGLLVLLSVAVAVWATRRRGKGVEYS